MAEKRKAEKRKAETRLSIEDATAAAERKRQDVAPYIPKEGFPLEIQLVIWSPVVREMSVLDLMDVAWIPSWGLEGVRFLLSQDSLWTFFWDRDFRKTDFCKDIPLRIPEFLTAQDETRGTIPSGDQIFIALPWRRYWIWTYYTLRTLTKVVCARVNQDVLAFKRQYERGELYLSTRMQENISRPPGVIVDFRVFNVEDRHFTNIQQKQIGPPSLPHENYLLTTNAFIWNALESQLPNDLPPGAVWVASQIFWENPWEWSLPVYMARYLISMGLQTFEGVATITGRPFDGIAIPPGNAKYILSWLIWCLMESTIPDPDGDGGDAPYDQGNTRREVLDWMARHLAETTARRFPMREVPPIIPRKFTIMEDEIPRNRIFLGDQICSNCSKNEGLKQCKNCKKALYCGKECQKEHWNAGHKSECCK